MEGLNYMNGPLFYAICGLLILLASTITAVGTIVNFVRKPATKYREKHEQELMAHDKKLKEDIMKSIKEILPELLKEHDIAVRDRYKADRDRYLNEIKCSVLEDTQAELSQIKILGIQYEALMISARDVLREKIVKIYTENRDSKKIPMLQKEKLDQFYKDYKALNGNSYIDKYYKRMCKWEVDDDDPDESDDIV